MSVRNPQPVSFQAIVLAGERGPNETLARSLGVKSKSVIPVDGRPMLERVAATLVTARSISAIALSGPAADVLDDLPALRAKIDAGSIVWRSPQPSPSRSVADMLSAGGDGPALVTTADHPLLHSEAVDYFCTKSAKLDVDLVIGLAQWSRVREAFPGLAKTRFRFRDDDYCGCNLFAFLTPESHRVATVWQTVEQDRKRTHRVVGLLGWWNVLRYMLRRLSLDQATTRLSDKLGLRIGVVVLPWADAAVDVDTLEDRQHVERRLADR